MKKRQLFIFRPPFLYIPEENSFYDMWEAFCYVALNIHDQTNQIIRIRKPDFGIDLYDQSKKIAYQCKSVEEGNNFHVENAKNSFNKAIKAKKEKKFLWDKFIICTNITLSAKKISNLRKAIKDVGLYQEDFWRTICYNNQKEMSEYFRFRKFRESYLGEIIYDPLYKQIVNETRKFTENQFIDESDSLVKSLGSFLKLITDLERKREWKKISNDLRELCEKTRMKYQEFNFLPFELAEKIQLLFNKGYDFSNWLINEVDAINILKQYHKTPKDEWLNEDEYFINTWKTPQKFYTDFEQKIIKSEEYIKYMKLHTELKELFDKISKKLLYIY